MSVINRYLMVCILVMLDAAELDDVIFHLTKSQFSKIFKYIKTGFVSTLDPEIDVIIKLLIWKCTLVSSGSTIGQNMMNMQYRNEFSKTAVSPWMTYPQKRLYALLLIGCPWLKDRSSDILKLVKCERYSYQVNKVLLWLENGLKVLTLVNFLVFLQKGVYKSIYERFLGIRSVFPRPQLIRQVSFEFMTRELLWHGFAELLFFMLPLINFQRIKNFVLRRLPAKMKSMQERTKADYEECSVCGEWPIGPHEIGCHHIFCYYCIVSELPHYCTKIDTDKCDAIELSDVSTCFCVLTHLHWELWYIPLSNYKADPNYCCPKCNMSVVNIDDVKPVLRTLNKSPA